MTTLVTTINKELCIVTTAEDMNEAYDVHQAKTDSAIVDTYGEAGEACKWGNERKYIRKDFVTYVDGKYSYEGYYTVQDASYWDYGDTDYQWYVRIRGIDYDIAYDLDEETEDWE